MKLSEEFLDEIAFFTQSDNYTIVHASSVNSLDYNISTLHKIGLRGLDFVKSFSNFIKRKMRGQKATTQEPMPPDVLIRAMQEKQFPDLYYVIFCTMFPHMKVNHEGYAMTESKNISKMI